MLGLDVELGLGGQEIPGTESVPVPADGLAILFVLGFVLVVLFIFFVILPKGWRGLGLVALLLVAFSGGRHRRW